MDYDIYREELAIRYPAYGHALWEPNPGGRYTSVEIGDVGFIRHGYFRRLFNILLPADHPSHQDGVPQHHEPLILRMTSPTDTGALQPNNFRSHRILDKSDEHRLGASGPDEAAQLSFLCPKKRGAILSLPVQAQRKDTAARGDFAKCMIKNINEWFAFAQERGSGISREDIILATGCHLARTWATVAFQERGEQIAFGFHVSGVSNVTWQFTPERAQGVAYNLGPSGQNLPENQCIFIRGFRVTRFSMILPRLRGAAGHAPLPDEDDPNPEEQLQSIFNVTPYQDPLRTVLEYIARGAPDCDMALVHDDDLQYVNTASLESLRPDAVLSYLRRSSPQIWQFSCDISPTSRGDKGKSKSKAPSQITAAALSKFDTDHELEPVIARNKTQEGPGVTSHRGHQKIPSPSEDVTPTTPFLNAVRKHFPSSQEKQGDDLIEQARDLLLSEVPSVVEEDDLQAIEDKISSAREMKVGLNAKSGIRKFLQAREYRKVAKEVYRQAKVSDRTLDRLPFQPRAGTLSEPFQFDIYTREHDPVYGSEDMHRIARSLYRCWLSCTDAFPSSLTQDNWVVGAWNQASLRTVAHPNLIRRDEEIKCDSIKFLTDIKTKIKHIVETSYKFDTRAPDSISHNESRAQALLASTTFIYRKFNFGGVPQYPYRHPIIQKVVNVTWFNNGDDDGVVFHEYFTPIPTEVIALAATVIECCIDEWSTGTYKESMWEEEHYKVKYLLHLSLLRDLDSHGPHQEGKSLVVQIRYDLLKNARIHAGVSPDSVIGEGRLNIDALDAAVREDPLKYYDPMAKKEEWSI